jgi:hypothetical protein
MSRRALHKVSFAALALPLLLGCGKADNSASSGGGGGGGGSGSATDSGADTGSTTGALTCSTPSTAYANNGGSCGTFRWAVKTGTDSDEAKVNLVPQVTTVPNLIGLPTNAGSTCSRVGPELQLYELRDVSLYFEALESDSDYHIIATDPGTGKTMITEIPFPGCVGHDSCQGNGPFLCAITHARAALDAKSPGAGGHTELGTGTVIGVGFFDTEELANHPGPNGEAPNGIELHPVLAICFGQGCNPLAGY